MRISDLVPIPPFTSIDDEIEWRYRHPEVPYTVQCDVTAEDIRTGRQNECGFCPVSLALSRDSGWPCEVYPDGIHLVGRSAFYGGAGLTFRLAFSPLPTEVASFLERFDTTGQGEPFSFTVVFQKYDHGDEVKAPPSARERKERLRAVERAMRRQESRP